MPVLVGGTVMPRAESLPESLRMLTNRQAIRLTHERFRADAESLAKAINDAIMLATKVRRDDRLRRFRHGDDYQEQHQKIGASLLRFVAEKERADWERIRGKSDADALRAHIAKWNGDTAYKALEELERCVWEEVGLAPDLTAVEKFLAEFPNGEYSEQAEALLRKLSTPKS
jgi:hypothetical protein